MDESVALVHKKATAKNGQTIEPTEATVTSNTHEKEAITHDKTRNQKRQPRHQKQKNKTQRLCRKVGPLQGATRCSTKEKYPNKALKPNSGVQLKNNDSV